MCVTSGRDCDFNVRFECYNLYNNNLYIRWQMSGPMFRVLVRYSNRLTGSLLTIPLRGKHRLIIETLGALSDLKKGRKINDFNNVS